MALQSGKMDSSGQGEDTVARLAQECGRGRGEDCAWGRRWEVGGEGSGESCDSMRRMIGAFSER